MLWALGIYNEKILLKTKFTLTQLERLSQKILASIDEFEIEKLSATAVACAQIFVSHDVSELAFNVIESITKRIASAIPKISNMDLVNILYLIHRMEYHASEAVLVIARHLLTQEKSLSAKDLCKVAIAISEQPLPQLDAVVEDFVRVLIGRQFRENKDDEQADLLVLTDAMQAMAKASKNKAHFKQLVELFLLNQKSVTPTLFTSAMMSFAKMRLPCQPDGKELLASLAAIFANLNLNEF